MWRRAGVLSLVAILALLRSSRADGDDDDAAAHHYPRTFRLGDILDHWNPDVVTLPTDWGKYDSLYHLDYMNATQREFAELLRDAEWPYVISNIPEMEDTVKNWGKDEYLINKAGKHKFRVEHSSTNRFMYYSHKSARDPSFDAPQDDVEMTMKEWLDVAKEVRDPGEDHWYLHARGTWGSDPESQLIIPDFPMFQRKKSLWIVDISGEKVVHCRCGMAGDISEAHYDGGRNYVFMARGHKRWIILPPKECEKLHMMQDGHFRRHSALSWADPSSPTRYDSNLNTAEPGDPFFDALGIDIVLGPGEAMYVPSYWNHYVINLDDAMQCNARSGMPNVGHAAVQRCMGSTKYNNMNDDDIEGLPSDVAKARTAVPEAAKGHHVSQSSVVAELAAEHEQQRFTPVVQQKKKIRKSDGKVVNAGPSGLWIVGVSLMGGLGVAGLVAAVVIVSRAQSGPARARTSGPTSAS